QLPLGRAALGRTSRAGLAQAVRRTRTARFATGVPEPIAEAPLHPRLARLGDEVGQVARLGRRDRGGEWRQNRDRHQLPRLALAVLFRADADYTVALVLTPDTHRITAAQAGVEQEVEGEAFPRTHGPLRLEAIEFLLRPGVEAVGVVRAGQQLDALGG